jgi:hypothetical protein
MKQTVHNSDFHDAFIKSGREANFSYQARNILFNWIEQLDADTGEETELDVIALCCEFTDHAMEDVLFDYGYMMDLSKEPDINYIREFLQENTILCGEYTEKDVTFFVYQQF